MDKISFLYSPIDNKYNDLKNTNYKGKIFSNHVKADVFEKTDLSFGKNKKIISQENVPYGIKLKNIYRERGFKEICKISSIFKMIKTKEEVEFLQNYVDKNKSHFTHKVLENIVNEFENFRKQNHRSMDKEELNIFNDFMIGLEYRTKCNDMQYYGNVLFELVTLAKDKNIKTDIINLLENKFDLYDYSWNFLDNNKENNFGNAIGKLIRYKQNNPEIADLIIPFATKWTPKGQNYSKVKEFFEFYKKEDKSPYILELSKNEKLDLQELKNIYENYIKNNSPFNEVFKQKLNKESFDFIKFMTNFVQKYPALTNILEKDLLFDDILSDEDFSVFDKRISNEKLEKLKSIPSIDKKIDIILSILPKKILIDWDKIISDDYNNEQIADNINLVYEMLSPIQRLESRNQFHYKDWIYRNKIITDCAMEKIKDGCGFDDLLETITNGYKSIFQNSIDKERGVKRTSNYSLTPYATNNYSEYKKRFDELANITRKPPYFDIEISKIKKISEDEGEIIHPHIDFVPKILLHAKKNYEEILKFVNLKKSDYTFSKDELKKINDNIAEIQYMLSVGQPYRRGTAGITNILVRSLYKSLGLTLPPTKNNVSPDLEAFILSLDEYKNNWQTFFETTN